MAWLNTVSSNGTVPTGKQSNATILFKKNGYNSIYQFETVEATEKRALDQDAAPGLVTSTDNTVHTTYWAHIGGVTYSFEAITGSRTERSGARKDESGQWVVVETVHTYTTSTIPNSWGTTELDADGNTITLTASGTMRVVSKDKSSSFVFNMSGDSLFTTLSTTVKEYRYVNSQASAEAIVNANTASSTYASVTHSGVVSKVCWCPYGTEKFASSRFVSNKEGWTVTVTEKAHGIQGQGWSASAL